MSILTKNAAITVSIRVFGAILIFILQIVLARMLGAHEYGIYAFVISWISVIGLVCTLGFDTSLTRYIPEYIQKKQWKNLCGVINFSFRACLIFSAVITILVLFIIIINNKFDSYIAFLYALPLITLITLTNIRISSLRSFKMYVAAIFPETILKPVIILVLVSLYYFLNKNISSYNVIVFQLISAGITFTIGMYFFKRTIKKFPKCKQPEYQPRHWLISSLPMLLITSSAYIISQTDIIMLGILGNMEQSGIYSAVSRVSEIAIFFMAAINFVASPLISESYHNNDTEKLNAIIWKSTKISFLLAATSFVIFVMFGNNLLGIFGGDFSVGYYALMILTVGHLANTATGPVGVILSLTGNQFYAAKIMGISALVNIFLNYILIPKYGLLGAALSTVTSTILWNILMLLKVKIELNINPSIISALSHEKS